MAKITHYAGENGDVTWDGRLCIHVGECGRSADTLFETGREPWCQPDLVQIGQAAEVISRCPTGALSLKRKDGGPDEVAESTNTVTVANNGPLYLRGELKIDRASAAMAGARFRAALCRCGQSKNKPFCDGSHESEGFVDRGAVGKSGDAAGGQAALEVKCAQNGPLILSGPFTIVAGSGRVAWRGSKAALCRCGASKDKPFCDGSHKTANFVAP